MFMYDTLYGLDIFEGRGKWGEQTELSRHHAVLFIFLKKTTAALRSTLFMQSTDENSNVMQYLLMYSGKQCARILRYVILTHTYKKKKK